MKAALALFTVTLLACDSGTTTDDGGVDDGGMDDAGADAGPIVYPSSINVGFDVINLHPAAAKALTRNGLTMPDVNGFTIFLKPLVQATGGTAVLGPGSSQTINVLGVNFTNVNTTTAVYGLVASIEQTEPDTGFPTCAQVHSAADGGPTADAGTGAIQDWFIPVYQQVGPFGRPTGDLVHQAAYLVPASYISLLDCAAGRAPGSLLNLHGALLTYASGQAEGKGGSLGSIAMSDPNSDAFVYYSDDYSYSASTTLSGSQPNGVSTLVGVPANGIVTISATDESPGSAVSFAPQTAWGPVRGLSMVFFSPQ
jgi:hypothetical protein